MLAYCISLHLSGCYLIARNWDIISIHWVRFMDDLKESLFFSLVGFILLAILFYINSSLLHASILTINPEDVKSISFFLFLPLFTYGILFPALYLIAFKCLSDRLMIKKAEFTVIFFSSFLFSLFFTALFIPLAPLAFLKGYLFYLLVTMILSYLYNQTKSLVTSFISFSLILIVVNSLIIFL